MRTSSPTLTPNFVIVPSAGDLRSTVTFSVSKTQITSSDFAKSPKKMSNLNKWAKLDRAIWQAYLEHPPKVETTCQAPESMSLAT